MADCVWTNDAAVFAAARTPEEEEALRALLGRIRSIPVPTVTPEERAASVAALKNDDEAPQTRAADNAEGNVATANTSESDPAGADDTGEELSPFSAAFDRSAATAMRFLRARDGDIDAAEKMWTDSLRWRVSTRLAANCRAWTQELDKHESFASRIVRSYWYGGHFGRDKRGVPMNLVRVGRGDPAGIVREAGLPRFIWQYVIALEAGFERLRAISNERDEWVNGFVDIFDMGADNVPHWTARAFSSASAFRALAKVMDLNYPERVHRAFVVRAPWIFSAIWKMFEPIIPKATKAKIGLYHSKWTAPLSEYVAADNFPLWLLEDSATLADATEADANAPVMTAEEAVAEADAAAEEAAESYEQDERASAAAAASPRRPHEELTAATFRPDVDFPGGVVPKRKALQKHAREAKRQCGQCGRPTVKTKRKSCKSCGSTHFVEYEDATTQEQREAEPKKRGWFARFWGS